jgi:hypothetical protein
MFKFSLLFNCRQVTISIGPFHVNAGHNSVEAWMSQEGHIPVYYVNQISSVYNRFRRSIHKIVILRNLKFDDNLTYVTTNHLEEKTSSLKISIENQSPDQPLCYKGEMYIYGSKC